MINLLLKRIKILEELVEKLHQASDFTEGLTYNMAAFNNEEYQKICKEIWAIKEKADQCKKDLEDLNEQENFFS